MATAKQALNEIAAHNRECNLRYEGIGKTLKLILSIMTWGGITAFGIIIGLLSWSLNQQFQTNMQARAEMASKIEALQAQLAIEQAAKHGP